MRHWMRASLASICSVLLASALCFTQNKSENYPLAVTVCQLKADPPAYNHKLVEVTAFVSHAFEDFTLFDPTCSSWPGVWLEYGGKAKSGTMYCCGVTDDRHRLKEMKVEDILIPLTDNEQFREFDRLIQPPFRSGRHGAIVHATLVGKFFSGRQIKYPKGTFWGGYGHMGCCSLMAIQEIRSVDGQDRDELDYGASADHPDIDKTGCGYRFLTPIDATSDSIKAQQEADSGRKNWVFDDPQHVASDALARLAHVEEQSISGMKEKQKAQGRYVYEWSPSGKAGAEAYMVVVSRPYVVSFYAHDPKRVAWVVAAAYVSSCGQNNSVTRIK
jgi:hypothetical protein